MRCLLLGVVFVVGCSKPARVTATHEAPLEIEAVTDFGLVEVDTASPRHVFTITPTKDTSWEREHILEINSNCPEFIVDAPGLPAQISRICDDGMGGISYGACEKGFLEMQYSFNVTFAPKLQGQYDCAIQLSLDTGQQLSIAVTGMGKKPALAAQFTPPSIAFGAIRVGASSTARRITISNAGSANHIFGPITVTNPGGATPFAIVTGNTGQQTIPPGGSTSVDVKCTPPAFGVPYTGKISIAHQDPKQPSPFDIPLTCVGLDSQIDLSPTDIEFPQTRVNEAIDLMLSIQNSGNIDDTLVSVAFQTGSNPALSFLSQPTNALLQSSGGNTVTTMLRFKPSAKLQPGTMLGNLVLTFQTEAVRTIPITGEAVFADADANPSSVDLGDVCIGETKSAPVTVFAMQEGSFKVTSITAPTGDFGFTTLAALPATAQPLRANEITFMATATPTTEGKLTGSATVVTDAPTVEEQTLPIELHAKGLPAGVAARPASVHFEDRVIAHPSYRKGIRVTNCQATPITVESVHFDGPDREDFNLVDEFQSTEVATRGELVIDVQAIPSHLGVVSGRLVIDTSMGQVFVDLDGNGLIDPANVKDPRDTYYTCETGRDGGWLVAGAILIVLRRRRRV